jgi:hypothetical protein
MRLPAGLILSFALLVPLLGVAATKEEPPDREMLKMMEFLREMEMIKQMEMLRDMHVVESAGDQAKNPTPQKSTPGKKKEILK